MYGVFEVMKARLKNSSDANLNDLIVEVITRPVPGQTLATELGYVRIVRVAWITTPLDVVNDPCCEIFILPCLDGEDESWTAEPEDDRSNAIGKGVGIGLIVAGLVWLVVTGVPLVTELMIQRHSPVEQAR